MHSAKTKPRIYTKKILNEQVPETDYWVRQDMIEPIAGFRRAELIRRIKRYIKRRVDIPNHMKDWLEKQ